jgi:SSS family solute:Na+ symporter
MLDGMLLASAGGVTEQLLKLSTLDMVIIAIYFGVVLLIGFYLKEFASTGEDFFMAGRKMTAWIAGLSFISANLSSLETMGWSAMAYQFGMLGAHAYFIGAIPAILFLAVVMMPFYYICKTHSVPGYLNLRYGEASRTLAGVSFTLMTVLVCGVNMFAMAKVMQIMLGWNIHFSIWVSSVTVAVYVALGGLLSAVFNEVVQFFLIWLGTLLVPILGLIEAGGWNKMIDSINAAHPGQNYTSLWANMGQAADNPMGMHWTGMVFGLGLAVSFGYWCTDFLQVQRVMAAKDLRSAQNGTIIGAAFKMLVPLIVTVPGLIGLAILAPKMGITLVSEDLAQATGGHSYNDVLPLVMSRYLGPGLLGLGVTAMIAGFMSGMAGNVSAFATVWTYDVYRPLIRKNASDAHYVSMGRWCSIIGVFIAIATAYAAMLFSNILTYLQVLVIFFIVPLFGCVIVGMLWKRATSAGGFLGFLLGILCSVGMYAWSHQDSEGFPTFTGASFVNASALAKDISGGKDPLASYLRGQVPADIRKMLPELAAKADEESQAAAKLTGTAFLLNKMNDKSHENERRVRASLLQGLNPTLSDLSLYDAQRFSQVKLSDRTQALLKETEKDRARLLAEAAEGKKPPRNDPDWAVRHQLKRLNRLLLEDAYAAELAKMPRFDATQLNPRHANQIALSPLAQDMAVNMYGGLWSLLTCVSVVVVVSLVTKPKSDAELANLVYGLTPLPKEAACPWYQLPVLWAGVVGVALLILNIIFW